MPYFPKCLTILLMTSCFYAKCQSPSRGEFATQSNGLMYADSSMKMLGHMVDSLNLRFKVCDLSRTYYSNPQGKLWSITFFSASDDMKDLRIDLDNNMSLKDLLNKYKSETYRIDTSLFVIETSIGKESQEIYYLTGTPSAGYKTAYSVNELKKKLPAGKWVYLFKPKKESHPTNFVTAFQIPQPLKQEPIPVEYARYIQYVDCMIDTNTQVFLAQEPHYVFMAKDNKGVKEMNDYLNNKMHLVKKKNDYHYDYLTEEKAEFAKSHLRKDAHFMELLGSAIDSCIANDSGNEPIDDLAAAFISKKKALELKRHRIVVGSCSQDQSPRLHARDIAILAAETNSWDIFLRAHLDIMNDRFQRVTDGSYAYAGRKTYLKELEELNLDVVDLILGLSLHATNLPDYHYQGTVWRLGWAMSESKDKDLFENKVLQMLKDDRLDDFNKGLVLILLQSYLNQLDDAGLANEKIRQLKSQTDCFPACLREAIQSIKERDKQKS
jgi:hypothetical protein